MRICIIGKFPPIQGGVSMRTYWTAHSLAAHGHEVHVVTNAKEAAAPFRMHMRAEDWARCATTYDSGSVTVHWTDPPDSSQAYIPMASAFVTKLAAVAGRVHAEHPFDVIYSHYLEPYAVAGYLVSQMTGVPHVVRMAGSDAGRLWPHLQFELVYDHVLRSAQAVIAAGTVAERTIGRGVAPERIVAGGAFLVPEDLFTPEGPQLDIPKLRAETAADPELCHLVWGNVATHRPYFGVYGKLGERKGSFALLEAMHRLADAGIDVGLVALAHGTATVEEAFRARAVKLGLFDRVLQIPFLPHWRIPEFLRGCLAVCCLEQRFPIKFHSPLIPLEVLLCGTCLVASTELIRKFRSHERLVHGYACVVIEDVDNTELLAEHLAALARSPTAAKMIGRRGRTFAHELKERLPALQRVERILQAAARREMPVSATEPVSVRATTSVRGDFPLTKMVVAASSCPPAARSFLNPPVGFEETIDIGAATRLLARLEQAISGGNTMLVPLAAAIRIDLAIAEAEDAKTLPREGDPLFRLQSGKWLTGDDLGELFPARDPHLQVVEFDYDVSGFLGAEKAADFPAILTPGPSYIVLTGGSNGKRKPIFVDEETARILILCDGSKTAAKIIDEFARDTKPAIKRIDLEWIEKLFIFGLIWLYDRPIPPAENIGARQCLRLIGTQMSGSITGTADVQSG